MRVPYTRSTIPTQLCCAIQSTVALPHLFWSCSSGVHKVCASAEEDRAATNYFVPHRVRVPCNKDSRRTIRVMSRHQHSLVRPIAGTTAQHRRHIAVQPISLEIILSARHPVHTASAGPYMIHVVDLDKVCVKLYFAGYAVGTVPALPLRWA